MTKIFNRYSYKHLRTKLRNSLTKGEQILWKHINCDKLGVRFRRQYGIGNYIVDFYCPILKFVIEIDGFTHGDEKIFENDLIRQKFLENIGLIVKRYNSNDIFNNLDNVLMNLEFTYNELKTRLKQRQTPPTPS